MPGDLKGGLRAATALLERGLPTDRVRAAIPELKRTFGLTSAALVVERREGGYAVAHISATVQRSDTPSAKLPSPEDPKKKVSALETKIAKRKEELAAYWSNIKRMSTKRAVLQLGPAYAGPSIPASGRIPTASERAAIQPLGRTHGCHTCGNKSAAVYAADHQPPSELFDLQLDGNPIVSPVAQVLVPQCEIPCSGVRGARYAHSN